MNKKPIIILAIFLTALLTINLVSAYGYSPDTYKATSYSKTTSKGYVYGPSETKTTNYHKATSYSYGFNGYEKITTYRKTTKVSTDPYYTPKSKYYGDTTAYPQKHYVRYAGDPHYTYIGSSWRYKPTYNYKSYQPSKYGYPNYYAPRYDPNLGHYNWRY